jgi:hypothetical protein
VPGAVCRLDIEGLGVHEDIGSTDQRQGGLLFVPLDDVKDIGQISAEDASGVGTHYEVEVPPRGQERAKASFERF